MKELVGSSDSASIIVPVQKSFWISFFEAPLEMAMVSQSYTFCLRSFNNDKVILVFSEAEATSVPPISKILEVFNREKPSAKHIQRFGRTKEAISVIDSLKSCVGVEIVTLTRRDSYNHRVTMIFPVWQSDQVKPVNQRVVAFDMYDISPEEFKLLSCQSEYYDMFYCQYLRKDQRFIFMAVVDTLANRPVAVMPVQKIVELSTVH